MKNIHLLPQDISADCVLFDWYGEADSEVEVRFQEGYVLCVYKTPQAAATCNSI
jgi:hypothetical protein